MKKILTLLAILLLLVGCGSGEKGEIKSAATEALETYRKEIQFNNAITGNEDAFTKHQKVMTSITNDFEFEISNILVMNNTAAVTVTFKVIDRKALTEAQQKDDEIKEASDQIDTGLEDDKLIEMIERIVTRTTIIADDLEKNKEFEMEIPFVKQEEKWTVDPEYDFKTKYTSAYATATAEVDVEETTTEEAK